ncbi:hypothetical protein NQ317_019801 [Molorchus minor]|uniref:Uncharacterized protein n=1 Tax=Molorchus minor TaxID=1323400 RepID=A0ABQ9JCV9_9CUCU|nr:hypothetical protein NQ317_019801 [Molorchus minor]
MTGGKRCSVDLGIIIGLYVSSLISDGFDAGCDRQGQMKNETAQEIIQLSVNKFAPKILTRKPNPNTKKDKTHVGILISNSVPKSDAETS